MPLHPVRAVRSLFQDAVCRDWAVRWSPQACLHKGPLRHAPPFRSERPDFDEPGEGDFFAYSARHAAFSPLLAGLAGKSGLHI